MGFMTGQKIYENFTNGTGPEGLSGSAAMVNELAAEYQEDSDAIRQLAAKMESVWQGNAAEAARRGAGPLATEHGLAAPHMATAQDLNGRQAGTFVDARHAVVPVPPEPTAPDPWAVFTSPGEVVPYRQKVADYNAANQHNVDVMTGYAGASTYNSKGMPQSYGSLTDDQAGIAVDPGTSDTGGGPRDGGPKPDDDSPSGGRGVAEWIDNSSRWVPPPPTSGPPGPGDAPPDSGGRPQETTPGGLTPAPGEPASPVPVGTGGGVGSGPPSGGGPGSGWTPGPGLVPVGGGRSDGSGGRGPGAGPGGRAVGGPGLGSEPDVRGPGGRAGGGEPHGSGGRVGSGPLAGGIGGEPHGAGRGAVAAARSGLGGLPMAAGGRSLSEEDIERYAPEFLQEDDPEALFGADELTAPPVIGEDLQSAEPGESLSAG